MCGSSPTRVAVLLVAIAAGPFLCDCAPAISIETVAIGSPGNRADTRYIDDTHPNGVGSVSDEFRMGKTEVTNAQYVAFLNAVARADPYGLYNTIMDNSAYG